MKDSTGQPYVIQSGSGFYAAMIDWTNPNAYQWYKNLIKNNIWGTGVSG